MKKMFVGNLPPDATETGVREMFAQYGTVRSIHLVTDIFTGKCRGFGFVEMEGHEARAAMEGLAGKSLGATGPLKIRFEDERAARRGGKRHR